MANSIKLELEKNRTRLQFYKARKEEQPTRIYDKWVEIYAERVKKLERQLQRSSQQARSSAGR